MKIKVSKFRIIYLAEFSETHFFLLTVNKLFNNILECQLNVPSGYHFFNLPDFIWNLRIITFDQFI